MDRKIVTRQRAKGRGGIATHGWRAQTLASGSTTNILRKDSGSPFHLGIATIIATSESLLPKVLNRWGRRRR